ncbi:MAG: Long-chain-fatty-acid--CoA ligase FadD15 [Gammaproteobacteria bacterium]|nr:Long-chain-fatty-acid--CoA ligase FadD15 [Gammaproteobacteria bacterium]
METVAGIYPEDALAGRGDLDVIDPDVAPTLDAQFAERVRRSGRESAYIEYDESTEQWVHYTWDETAREVRRWQAAFEREGLQKGDRVALRLRNCRHWVIFDQAALGLGLVVVPLYAADRPDNVNYVLDHSDAVLVLVSNNEAWTELHRAQGETPRIKRIVVLEGQSEGEYVRHVDDWLGNSDRDALASGIAARDDLASIVYTSGTTGRPKGVKLSHRNMVCNAYSGLRSVAVDHEALFLSFLPLSHTLERTVGYYVPVMAGAKVAYNRSLKQLSADLLAVRPTGIVTVPKIFEHSYRTIKDRLSEAPVLKRWLFNAAVRIGWNRFEYRQGRGPWDLSFLAWPLFDKLVAKKIRDKLGGRLSMAVVGGAPCTLAVSRVFIAMEIMILQGYGLTESSPSIAINTLGRNRPDTVGLPLHGVEVRVGNNDELLARGPNIMMGYWKDDEATRKVLTDEGWLHSGDQVEIEDGFIRITGRLKDILVLANGEKVAPADMEAVIVGDPLFGQAMVVGERMPYLAALVVLDEKAWRNAANEIGVDPGDESALKDKKVEEFLLEKISGLIHKFPGYARIESVTATLTPWTVEDGLLTPTLKVKRPKVWEVFEDRIEKMYEGYDLYRVGQRQSA